MYSNIQDIISASIAVKTSLLNDKALLQQIELTVNALQLAFKNGNRLWLCGNGGSAADAQHIAAEFSGRFYKDRKPLPAEALHVNSSYLTAVANDYGYDMVYARMLEAAGKAGDVLIGISTSGNSINVIKAMEKARAMDMHTVSFSGSSEGMIDAHSDICIKVPSNDTPRIQEAHILIGHIICELVESSMF